MSTVTWANATRGMPASWHMRLPGAAAWPSVDDQLGITPRTDSPGCVFASRKRVSAAHMTFTSDMPTYRGTSSALGPELAETRFYGACRL